MWFNMELYEVKEKVRAFEVVNEDVMRIGTML